MCWIYYFITTTNFGLIFVLRNHKVKLLVIVSLCMSGSKVNPKSLKTNPSPGSKTAIVGPTDREISVEKGMVVRQVLFV